VKDVLVVVPVRNGEEDELFGETVNQFVEQNQDNAEDAPFMMVKSEYRSGELFKTVIFEDSRPASQFQSLWRRQRRKLAASGH